MRDQPLAESLRLAAGLVSAKGRDAIRILSPTPATAAGRRDGRHGLMHDGALHAHSCVEACAVIDGTCRLWTPAGHTLLTPDGGFLVIPPQVAHGEGWHRREEPYVILWLMLVGDYCSAFVNSYAPGKGWRANDSVSIVAQTAALVTRLFDAGGNAAEAHPAPPGAYLLQGALLVLLASLLLETDSADGSVRNDDRRILIAQVRNYIDLHYAEPLSVAAVARLFRLSANHMNSLFARHEGVGIHAYLLRRRLHVAHRLLAGGDRLVKQVAFAVGFADPLYFSRLFKRRFGYPPSAARGR